MFFAGNVHDESQPVHLKVADTRICVERCTREYGNPCEAIYQSRFIQTLPLEGLEHFSLDGVDYEAFNTSGGVGTLCEDLAFGRASA